ncbi:MAG: HEPN domain-containing protein [Rhodoglobus sp.]
MSAEALIASFLRIANEDLAGARQLSSTGNRNAMYLCSQAAEKIIRAVLTSEGKNAGIKHQLDELVDMVPDENPIKPALRSIQDLSDYATSYRYPSPKGRIKQPPDQAAFDREAASVQAALDDAANRFGVDLTSLDGLALRATPLR